MTGCARAPRRLPDVVMPPAPGILRLMPTLILQLVLSSDWTSGRAHGGFFRDGLWQPVDNWPVGQDVHVFVG
jgi:hypothetical protein